MIVSLSASQPIVSATAGTLRVGTPGRPHELAEGFVDPLDQVVSLLVETVDVALGGRHLVVVLDARLVLLVPQLDVRRGEPRDELSDRVVHRRSYRLAALSGEIGRASCRERV